MAAVGTVLSVAQTMIAALDSEMLIDICSVLNYRSELDGLRNTVAKVRAVLLDAEKKDERELSNLARDWIEKLKDAVYDADDLLDEFTTLAEQKQLLKGGKFTKELRAFFSRYNQVGVVYNMSRGIKKMRGKLDAIARDHSQFGFVIDNKPILKRNPETCSYVIESNVIGREDDKKAMIDRLLDPDVQDNVSFVTIVGVGGLGKTALAQLVYNDETIKNEFSLKMWVCVSDQDPEHFDMKAVLCMILEAATKRKPEGSDLDRVQIDLREELKGKKYLLVLDDVWNENRNELLRLGEFLMGGGVGSRIVVTTRSMNTARNVGNGHIHELKGLSEENSWLLFEGMAFLQGQKELHPNLVEIGKRIVSKCANVPLAIRVVGTLLYGQEESKWQTIERYGLAAIDPSESDIIHVLKLSYHHLDHNLKSCFSYCAIFPKDYVIFKQKLVSLWIAQGYVKAIGEDDNLEDVGNQYFSILVRRCFFQEAEIDKNGEFFCCKMHDLMHNIAQQVAGREICVANCIASKVDEKVRHVFVNAQDFSAKTFPKIRTCVMSEQYGIVRAAPLLTNCTYLRALTLRGSSVQRLPYTIGKLLHLRYLDLSDTSLEKLPEEITKLHNLQTLNLQFCGSLIELPRSLSELVKLRLLDTTDCALTSMPSGMENLTCLRMLPSFIVAESNPRQKHVGEVKDLGPLINLKGDLVIKIIQNTAYVKENGGGGFLKNKEHLNGISLVWAPNNNDEKVDCSAKLFLEDLQPHNNLKRLTLDGYPDEVFPSWASEDNLSILVPNLVRIEFSNLKRLQHLPLLGKLGCLKSLEVVGISNLVYMEDSSTTSPVELPYFPSLECLLLCYLDRFEGWRKGDDQTTAIGQSRMLPSFPRLSHLSCGRCPRLTWLPHCPSLETLVLYKFHEGLQMMISMEDVDTSSLSSVYPPSSLSSDVGNIRKLSTDNAGHLRTFPMKAFQCLSEMSIFGDRNLESLSEIKGVLQSCSSSLQELHIGGCDRLRNLSGVLVPLTALKSLSLIANIKTDNCGTEDDIALPCNLRHLSINFVPKGIQHLTALQNLVIPKCSSFERKLWQSVPDGIEKLSSLKTLELRDCSPDMELRLQNPDGEDWPKIQHIPNIFFNNKCIRGGFR